MLDLLRRRLYHFYKSGCIMIGIDHFLVMFPSAILVAKLSTTSSGQQIISLSTILFCCGLGTILFLLITRKRIPFFLGPSFAYIGLTSYLMAFMDESKTIEEIRCYILWGYVLSGILLLVIAIMYKYSFMKRAISFFFPDVIMGPAISLIGLELASIAADDSGITIKNEENMFLALLTLLAIILATLIKRKFLTNASVLIGIFVGCLIAFFMHKFDVVSACATSNIIQMPSIHLFFLNIPDNFISLFFMIIPPTIIAFTESLGRITMLEGMFQRESPKKGKIDNIFYTILKGHAISHIFMTVLFGSVPIAIYAENIAIMNISNTYRGSDCQMKSDNDLMIRDFYDRYSIYPYILAAVISIIVACIQPIQHFFYLMPKPIIGGMELFIFGLIAAPGIQMLVEKKVDYKKVSNQIITASVLLAGVSNITVSFFTINLTGMSLGLTIGVLINILVKILAHLGILNEKLNINDVIDICLEIYKDNVSIFFEGIPNSSPMSIMYKVSDLKAKIKEDNLQNLIHNTSSIILKGKKNEKKIVIKQINEDIIVEFNVNEKDRIEIQNDYGELLIPSDENILKIWVNSKMTIFKLKKIISKIR